MTNKPMTLVEEFESAVGNGTLLHIDSAIALIRAFADKLEGEEMLERVMGAIRNAPVDRRITEKRTKLEEGSIQPITTYEHVEFVASARNQAKAALAVVKGMVDNGK